MTPCLIAAMLLSLAEPTPAAMVIDVKGEATLQRGASKPRPLGLMDVVAEGDRLQVPKDGFVVLFRDGDRKELRLKPGREVRVTAKGVAPADAVEGVQTTAAGLGVDVQEAQQLARSGKAGAATLRSPDLPENPLAIEPMFGAAVRTDRPTFRWPAVEGAELYRVEVKMAGSGRVLWQVEAKSARLPYPEGQRTLDRNRGLHWTVSARLPGKAVAETVAEGRFKVLSAAQAEALKSVDKALKGDSVPALLLAAVQLQEQGVYDESLRAYERLAKLRPFQPHLWAALADHYARAGRTKEADEALRKAESLGYTRPQESDN